MAKVIKHHCDWPGCKDERAIDEGLQVFSHSEMDPSGNGYNHWNAVFDLCALHLKWFADALIKNSEDTGGKITPLVLVKKLNIHYEMR
jgi:hypothetical protein